MGAALYLDSLVSTSRENFNIRPNLGANLDENSFQELSLGLDPTRWNQFSTLKTRPLKKADLLYTTFQSEELLVEWVAHQIFRGRIVGWCQGKSENGPRALGYRSILMKPDDVELAQKLSKKIKLRAPFRPYALALTAKQARKYLKQPSSAPISRWMQFSYEVVEFARPMCRATLHIDNTTRAQCVFPEDNLLFYRLLEAYGKLSGCEALLNTSFNESGLPIVNDAADALLMFARTDLDMVIYGNMVLEKRLDATYDFHKDNSTNTEGPHF